MAIDKGTVQTAQQKLDGAKKDVKDDEDEIRQYQSDIQDLKNQIRVIQDRLPGEQLAVEDAAEEADQLLRQIEKEIGLDIETAESSVPQGGEASFKAVYDHSSPLLPNGDLVFDLGVQLLWDTGGCSIKSGTVHSEDITVDTSSVDPGDYGISVSLTFV